MLLLLLLVTAALPSSGQNASGTVNSDGVCECSVILPDNTFPVQRMEYLERTSWQLNISVQQEINKTGTAWRLRHQPHDVGSRVMTSDDYVTLSSASMGSLYDDPAPALQNVSVEYEAMQRYIPLPTQVKQYAQTLSVHTAKLLNLTRRVERIETGGSYTQLDFELLKLEIQELVSLTSQLKVTINGSNTIIDQLYIEIENISRTVNELESYDKLNVLAIRREITSLRKRLSDCEKNEVPIPQPIDYGSCNHGGIINVTEPFVTQLNWLGFSYKFGGWGKDPAPLPSQKQLYWVAPLVNEQRLDTYRVYSSYDDLLLYRNPVEKTLVIPGRYPDYGNTGQGSGMVLYNNSLYYNCFNTRDMCRVNVDTGTVQRVTLNDAVFNNRFSYQGVKFQDMDFAVDETGLWVIYSTDKNAGNMVISKINITSFTVERTWVTRQFKPGVTNAFMICGVLYAIRPVSTREEEIFYTFDTRTGEEGTLAIKMDKVMEILQSVNYNPSDHKLYVYNDGYQVTYDVVFKPYVQPPIAA